ncbi:hypothetical protein GIB67_019670 [Kingdonia uniflora]|uniref:Protein kinase domain-containing protein n=1 Tax=Kingdonia uniflora TaxID=39325 RepID=A0A7J7MK27_9MAGN|nr:hypothetical protein GIB67_019670 [Kingdonia uniflora]
MNHPNTVKLKEVIREYDILYFVFEYMECNLYQLIKDRGKLFSETEVRNWYFQVFQALSYMHQNGYFHRDLKPENLLVTKESIKIANFVDIWAMGAIMAELFTLEPLFPGLREPTQIYKICKLAGVHLSTLIPSASENVTSLIYSLCSWDPSKRPTATEALQHPFFQSCFYTSPSLRSRVLAPIAPPTVRIRAVLDQKSTSRIHYLAAGDSLPPDGARGKNCIMKDMYGKTIAYKSIQLSGVAPEGFYRVIVDEVILNDV